MSELRIAVAQAAVVACDLGANALTARRLLGAAKNLGANLVVFPELFLSGDDLKAIATQPARAAMVLAGGQIGVIRGRCASLGLAAVVGGCLARDEGLTNAAIVIDQAGEIAAVYEKVNLSPSERSLFVAGSRPVTCDVLGFRLGLAIGADAAFPEHARSLALAGAEAIACPATFARGEEQHRYRLFFPTRALENTVYLAVANLVGADAFGESAVFDPTGRVLAVAGDGEDVIVADVDRTALESVRAEAPFLDLLRSDVYREAGDGEPEVEDGRADAESGEPSPAVAETAAQTELTTPVKSRRRRSR